MKCPSCGKRALASLSNCPHCDAHLDNGAGATQGFQQSPAPEGNANHWQTQSSNTNVQVVSGKTMLAILGGFGVLGAIIFLVVPLYHDYMGHEGHYRVLWCTSTASGSIGTAPDEIRAQGFSAQNRMAPGYSRLGEEERMSRVQCFSKDYGQERPSYRNIDRRHEYRVVSTYYAAPEESGEPGGVGEL